MSTPAPRCSCIICHKNQSAKGICSHYLVAHTKEGNERARAALKIASKTDKTKAKGRLHNDRTDYELNPNFCSGCGIKLDYSIRNNKFCSHSCAATYSNNARRESGWTQSSEQRAKTSATLKSKERIKYTKIFFCSYCNKHHSYTENKRCPNKVYRKSPIEKKRVFISPKAIVGEFSKVYFCRCKYCSSQFIHKTVKQICPSCIESSTMRKAQYRFKFNVYDFPDLFDLTLLTEIGFYSPGGKSGKWNIDGLSRDHKVSVSDAIKYNYDPFYITHPLNCELMTHRENNKKKTKSSIDYNYLKTIVDEYEMIHSGTD